MTRTQFRALAVAAALGIGSALWMSKLAAQEDQPPKPSSKMADSARKAYVAYNVMYGVGQAMPEEIYRWSRRLMEAELKADPTSKEPAKDHWKRMRDLQNRISTLNKVGAVGGEECHAAAAEYYVAEAESDYWRES